MGKRPLSGRAAAVSLCALLASPGAVAAGQDHDAPALPAPGFADAGFLAGATSGRSASGRTLLADAGARALGMRGVGRGGWLALWDARLTGTAGTAAQASPAPPMTGWSGRARGELGRRLRPWTGWSPYLGGSGAVRLRWLHSRTGGPERLNQMAGASGLTGSGAVRLGAGVSVLDGERSMLLVAFLQGARRPTGVVPEETFADLGVAARLDLGDRLSASLQASRGWSTLRRDRALRTTDRTTHEEVDAAIRIGLWSAWVELEGRASRDQDRLAYAGGRTYHTVGEPDLQAGLAIGAWVWR